MSGLQPTASASLRRAHPFLSDVRAASNALRPYIRPATVRRSPAYTGAFGVQRGELSIKKIFREFPPPQGIFAPAEMGQSILPELC